MSYQISVQKCEMSRISEIDFNNIHFGKNFTDHMFVADYRDGEWQDARIEPFSRFAMHPASIVLHYGQSVFEGMKASKSSDGKPLLMRPELHARRLNESARRICIQEVPEELFLEGLHLLVGLDAAWIPPQKGSALYIRPFIFATDEFIGVHVAKNYRFMIICSPAGPYYSKPVRLKVERHYVRAVPGGTGEAKAAGNYGGSLYPTQLAKEQGYDQIMWMGGPEMKDIQEVGTMNIFFVIDGKIITPATDGAILKGITRRTAIQWFRDQGITVEERRITIDEVDAAYEAGTLEEVFGTGTAAVVAFIAEIGYDDKLIKLPEVKEDAMSKRFKRAIEALRAGEGDDPHGWIVPVEEPVLESFA